MKAYAAAITVLGWQMLAVVWAIGATDCSGPSSNVVSLQAPLKDAKDWYEGETVLVEGRVQSIAGAHGHRTFLLRGSDGEAEVVVLSAADVDMSVHEGERVRVEGILDMSTSSSAAMLLLRAGQAVEEAVLLCHQPVQQRKLSRTWKGLGFGGKVPSGMSVGLLH